MRPTFSQQTAIAGLSALAHLSVAGLLLAFAAPPPLTPPKPLPVTVTLIPSGSASSAAAPSASGAAAAPPVAAPVATPEVAPALPPPLPVSPPVALAPPQPEPEPEPKPKPKPKLKSKPKPKPKVESPPKPQPKPKLAAQPPPKPIVRATPPTRWPQTDSATPIRPAQLSMAGPTGAVSGANSSTTLVKAGSGSGRSGTATDGHAAGDRQAAPAYQPKPHYPAFARRLGHEGRVVIRVQVLSSGAVGTARIEHSSGYAALDEAALATIKRWRFRPAQRGGRSVDATVNVPISFKLSEQG